MKTCLVCGNEYSPTGPAQKYCQECGIVRSKEIHTRAIKEYRRRKGVMVGIGSGNNQSGEKNGSWKGGIGIYHKLKSGVKACENCGKHRPDNDGFGFCTHHKDGNRYNNSMENLEVLCKRCHQLVHHCEVNLPNKV